MNPAIEKLAASQQRARSLVSIGLEPSFEYMPKGFAHNLEGCEEFMRTIIEATEDAACAFKVNLAFFESHGWEGTELLYAVREMVPENVFFIADAKRSDIGSTAAKYAKALYESLEADAATVNPLMGRDSAEPFLAYKDKLTYFLGLTSNPGAEDFLLQDDLYLRIARKVQEWNVAGNCGLVAGATRPGMLGGLRREVPGLPFLVPGVGAQGGDAAVAVREAGARDFDGSVVLHVTRGVLPAKGESGDVAEIINRKAQAWRAATEAALSGEGGR